MFSYLDNLLPRARDYLSLRLGFFSLLNWTHTEMQLDLRLDLKRLET